MNLTSAEIKFSDYNKRNDIHGTVLYPGVMVAPVQKIILSKIINGRNNLTILDPFHGSGTALYEAGCINENLHLMGFDINPLANLITTVKLTGIDNRTIDQDILKLRNHLNSGNYSLIHFSNIDKWFKRDKISLSKICSAIKSINNQKNRKYFWVVLCDIIRRYSNTRSSTYKLHNEQQKINNIQNNAIEAFLKNVVDYKSFYEKSFPSIDIRLCDTLNEIKKLDDNSIDIVVTSPPYGDNATTIPYGQFSHLALNFIDKKDLVINGWELENACIIDSRSIGGCLNNNELTNEQKKYIQWYLSRIEKDKQKKVKRYFADFFIFLDELARICKEYAILTLGNRTVDKQRINLTSITKKYLSKYKFQVEYELIRKLGIKRIPNKTSLVREVTFLPLQRIFIGYEKGL